MPLSRYKNASLLNLGTQYGTTRIVPIIRLGVSSGTIPLVDSVTISGNQRLDHLASKYYKDSRLWWVLAAASEIGWGLQIPPGTIINVPDLDYIVSLV